MKILIKLGIVLGFTTGGAIVLFSGSTKVAAAASESLTSPRTLYVSNCASCHGSNGKAQTATGRDMDADDISGGTSTTKTIRVVTNGRGKMPSFKKRLTTAQIKSIANYVHTL